MLDRNLSWMYWDEWRRYQQAKIRRQYKLPNSYSSIYAEIFAIKLSENLQQRTGGVHIIIVFCTAGKKTTCRDLSNNTCRNTKLSINIYGAKAPYPPFCLRQNKTIILFVYVWDPPNTQTNIWYAVFQNPPVNFAMAHQPSNSFANSITTFNSSDL